MPNLGRRIRNSRQAPRLHSPYERGQAIVLLVFAMIVLMGFLGLSIDGGRVFTLQRDAQNVADVSALAGTRAKCLGQAYAAAALSIAAANGYDNNGTTNTVTVNVPPTAGTYVGNSNYVEVFIVAEIDPGFIQLLFSGPLEVTVRAEGHCTHGLHAQVTETMFALGPCPDIKAIDVSGSDEEIIGGIYSNDDLYVSGANNDFHGSVTTVEGTITTGAGNQYDSGTSTGSSKPNPLASLTTADYGPGGSRVSGLTVYDVSSGGTLDLGRLTSLGLYNAATGLLDTGVYYAGNQKIELSDSNMHGNVTLVSEDHIISSGSNVQLEPYVDGMIMFSNKQPGLPCKDWVINLGGSGTAPPTIPHPSLNPITDTDNFFYGLIYAPRGLVQTSGSKTTIRGAIIGQGIKLNGTDELIIFDDQFFPLDPSIELSN